MLRIFVFALCLLSISSSGRAQSYEIVPDDTLRVSATPNEMTIFDIYQKNLTQEPLLLGWKRVSNNLVEGWDFSLCDLGSCYAGLPEGATMDTAFPGDEAFLGLNIDPKTIPGTGVVRIYVYDTKRPDDGDTLTWIVQLASSGVESVEAETFYAHPNPFISNVNISFGQETSGEIIVRSLDSKVAARMNVDHQSELKLDMSSASAGHYFVEYRSTAGNRVIKVIKDR